MRIVTRYATGLYKSRQATVFFSLFLIPSCRPRFPLSNVFWTTSVCPGRFPRWTPSSQSPPRRGVKKNNAPMSSSINNALAFNRPSCVHTHVRLFPVYACVYTTYTRTRTCVCVFVDVTQRDGITIKQK